jgi:antitoxin MazE
MQAKIIAIGTSKGVRIPKYLIDKYGFKDEIDLEDTGSGILLKIKNPRAGWSEAFAKGAVTQADALIEMPSSEWDRDEWMW